MQGKRCRFESNCRNWAQGNCKYDHSQQNGGGGWGGGNRPHNAPNYGGGGGYKDNRTGGGNGYGSSGGGGSNNPNSNYNPNGNYPKSYPPSNNPNHSPNYNPNYKGNGGKGSHGNPIGNNKSDEFSKLFCRNFHLDIPCKFEQKCSRQHAFDLDKPPKMRRVLFKRDVPTDESSKLGKFLNQGKCYLVMRMGNAVTIMTFMHDENTFNHIGEWNFPSPTDKYYFYSQKDNFIYLAVENSKSMLNDVLVYNMLTSQLVTIADAHELAVTGALHVSPNILLTSSKDGKIKVWRIEGAIAILDKDTSDKLSFSYSENGTVKTQIMFLDYQNIKGTNIIAAGTSDSRLLFFIGDGMNFNQTKVYMIKYHVSETQVAAFVVTWALDNTSSAVVAVDLNQFKTKDIVTSQAAESTRNNIYLIETIGDRLFVSYLNGTVNFYELPTMQRKGIMMHGNYVNSMIQEEYITSTNIQINKQYFLEGKFKDKQGSIGVYIMKQ